MKFYLSSYRIGNQAEKLKSLVPKGKKLGVIPNALDYIEPELRRQSNERCMNDLTDIGINIEMLDLQNYFNRKDELRKKIRELGGIWIKGGNVFVLRQAMRLSGLDIILKTMRRKDFLYGGYSAAGCILSPKLDYLNIVDDPSITPYKDKKIIWEGLGLIDYAFLPHYQSNHPESEKIDKEVQYCKDHKIPFKTLRDGEVIIIE